MERKYCWQYYVIMQTLYVMFFSVTTAIVHNPAIVEANSDLPSATGNPTIDNTSHRPSSASPTASLYITRATIHLTELSIYFPH